MAGSEATKGTAMPIPKATPFLPRFLSLSKPWQWRVQIFTTTTPARLTGVFHTVLGQKAELPPKPFWLSSRSSTCWHSNAFLTDELTNDRYLVDTGVTLSIAPRTANSSPSGPLLKGANGQPIPYWGFI
jgi:hypothetical protein